MPKRTSYVAPADRAVTTTAVCGSNRHDVCPGRIVSLTAAHGQACACPCHAEGPQGKVA